MHRILLFAGMLIAAFTLGGCGKSLYLSTGSGYYHHIYDPGSRVCTTTSPSSYSSVTYGVVSYPRTRSTFYGGGWWGYGHHRSGVPYRSHGYGHPYHGSCP